ncbi:type 1 glutamine amidotransferase [Novosphingobium profundi]|uniref:type 1 glutamine amidotransferase domain-containing protein n=1 Tax=Novosphingobium profundi TaxID=1774954 RepID=UPI001BDA488A|nr:type 1 glutamine amidotransferase domain-containing protein [Novosphingobium profundi]MBT0669640.1 type 1 glutamine amidotransferase [Novosphingobium profundi]
MTQRILILATNGFEQSELTGPRDALREAGMEVVVASPETGEIKGWQHTDWGDSVPVDMALDDVRVSAFDGLVLPGGQMNPDILRNNTTAVELVQAFAQSGKPVAAICHAPWLLVEADVVRGRTVTGWPSIRTDLANAGAQVVDKEVVVDGNLITSRKPDDIPAFAAAMIAAVRAPAEAA